MLDSVALSAIALTGATIFTTIQIQDFPDIAGDAAIGRVTLPIYAPELSRWLTLGAMLGWSLLLGTFWEAGAAGTAVLLALGAAIGARCVWTRSHNADIDTYRLYNVRIIGAWLENAVDRHLTGLADRDLLATMVCALCGVCRCGTLVENERIGKPCMPDIRYSMDTVSMTRVFFLFVL
jgi:hypothetical protein